MNCQKKAATDDTGDTPAAADDADVSGAISAVGAGAGGVTAVVVSASAGGEVSMGRKENRKGSLLTERKRSPRQELQGPEQAPQRRPQRRQPLRRPTKPSPSFLADNDSW